MARIKPFAAYRPKPELASQVASPPYDVMNAEEARKLCEGNPLSFIRVIRSEVEFTPETNPYDEAIYDHAAKNLRKLIDQAVLIRDDKPRLYLYTQRMGNHVQTGIVALLSVDDYEKNVIKKHEKTRVDKEDDRFRHILTLRANTGPVFLLYRDNRFIGEMMEQEMSKPPVIQFTSPDGIQHTVRVIGDPVTIENIVSEFRDVPSLYIADGHHRAAASVRACKVMRTQTIAAKPDSLPDYFMGVIFPASHLSILPYNRAVKDLNGLNEEAFLRKIGEKFEVTEVGEAPNLETHVFGMYLKGKWYAMKAKSQIIVESDPLKSLDVSILQDHLLGPTLGIQDPRTSNRINFIGGIRGIGELERIVDDGKFAVSFSLSPTTVEDLMRISDSGEVMPPKSTWFEPKLKSGLFVNKY